MIYVKTHSEASVTRDEAGPLMRMCCPGSQKPVLLPALSRPLGCASNSASPLCSAVCVLLPHSVLVKCTPGQKNTSVSSGICPVSTGDTSFCLSGIHLLHPCRDRSGLAPWNCFSTEEVQGFASSQLSQVLSRERR